MLYWVEEQDVADARRWDSIEGRIRADLDGFHITLAATAWHTGAVVAWGFVPMRSYFHQGEFLIKYTLDRLTEELAKVDPV